MMDRDDSDVYGNFYCPHCPRTFHRNSLFDKHLLLHTSEKRHECEICKTVFFHTQVLENHMVTHSNERPFNCDFSSKWKFSLKMLLKRRHPNVTLVCEICSNSFTPSTIDSHDCDRFDKYMFLHANENRHECDICKSVFPCKQELTRHMVTHSDELKLKCSICDYSCSWKGNLQLHLQLYHPHVTLVCEICCKRCTPSNIDNHDCDGFDKQVLLHANENLQECNICKSVFPCNQELTRHMVTHSVERKFKWGFGCDYSCSWKGNLQLHLQLYHPHVTLVCEICCKRCTPSVVVVVARM